MSFSVETFSYDFVDRQISDTFKLGIDALADDPERWCRRESAEFRRHAGSNRFDLEPSNTICLRIPPGDSRMDRSVHQKLEIVYFS